MKPVELTTQNQSYSSKRHSLQMRKSCQTPSRRLVIASLNPCICFYFFWLHNGHFPYRNTGSYRRLPSTRQGQHSNTLASNIAAVVHKSWGLSAFQVNSCVWEETPPCSIAVSEPTPGMYAWYSRRRLIIIWGASSVITVTTIVCIGFNCILRL